MVSRLVWCDCVAAGGVRGAGALRHGVRGLVRGGAAAQRPNRAPRPKRSRPRRMYLFLLCVYSPHPPSGLLYIFLRRCTQHNRKLGVSKGGARPSTAPGRKKRPQRNARSAPAGERARPTSTPPPRTLIASTSSTTLTQTP